MKKIIDYIMVILVLVAFIFSLHLIAKRDEANAKYWEKRQAECRSLGNSWDLNNQGKCVQFDTI